MAIGTEYKNRVVHSFNAVERSDPSRWIRLKGSLRGRASFSLNSVEANVSIFEECSNALAEIREWSLREAASLRKATEVLIKHMQDGGA